MSDAAVAPAGARPAAVAVPAAVPAPAAGDASELERLAALHDGGKLTDEEFAAAKRRVLGRLGSASPPSRLVPIASSAFPRTPSRSSDNAPDYGTVHCPPGPFRIVPGEEEARS